MKGKTIRILTAAILTAVVFAGCASSKPAALTKKGPIRTEPAGERPEWVDNPASADTPELQSFTGSAGMYATATGDYGSRAYAAVNGQNQLASYYGLFIVNLARTYAGIYGLTSEVLSPQVVAQSLNERISQSLVQALAAKEYYTEVFLDDQTKRESYQTYVLMQVEKSLVRRAIDNYGEEQAADYARRAAAEQDAVRRTQLEKAAEFFGGNLSSKLDL